MPAIILENTDKEIQEKITGALAKEFPDKLGEICVNNILELRAGGCHAYIQGSVNTDPAELAKIKELCAKFIEVRERESEPSPKPYIIYYGLGLTLLRKIQQAMPESSSVRWVSADPRLLNHEASPYVEIHEPSTTAYLTLKQINHLVDVEVYSGNQMEFYERPVKPTQPPAK